MVILLTQPALLLIDFGHFQYNSVMLGSFLVGHFEGVIIDRSSATALTLLSVNYMCKGQDLVAAIFFVASLGSSRWLCITRRRSDRTCSPNAFISVRRMGTSFPPFFLCCSLYLYKNPTQG